jgi:hypothetical protein
MTRFRLNVVIEVALVLMLSSVGVHCSICRTALVIEESGPGDICIKLLFSLYLFVYTRKYLTNVKIYYRECACAEIFSRLFGLTFVIYLTVEIWNRLN